MSLETLFPVFVFLAAACLVVPLASRFRLGSVLGYLIAGIVIGPWVLGLITDPHKVMHFAEFGVVMMLFLIGLELEPAMLWRLRRSIVGLGGLQVVLTSVLFTLAGILLGFSWQTSVAAAMALSLSSTALVLQTLQERKQMQTPLGQNAFSVLLFQDIAVIPILVLMPLLAVASIESSPAHASMIHDLPGYMQALAVGGVIVAVILAGRYLSYSLFRAVAKTHLPEMFTALSLAMVVGITLLMQLVGVSPALGAFVAGVVLANSEYRRTMEAAIEPFKGLLLGLFFISVGMSIDFGLLSREWVQIVGAVTGLMLIKAGILWGLGRMFGLSPAHNAGFALALSQGGEFAFVLFQFAGGLSVLSPEHIRFLTLVVALSIAITPLLMLFYGRVLLPRYMNTPQPEQAYDEIEDRKPIILAGFGRFGQVIGRFLTAQGVELTVLEKNPDQIDLIRKFGFKGYYGDATRLDVMRSAGAENAKMLVVAVNNIPVSLDIVRMARQEFPDLVIYARARNRRHAYELHNLGVHYFKRETFDSSLAMAQQIMVWLGRAEGEVHFRAEQFRKHDETTLQESFQFFEDESALVSHSKARRAELEQILQSDIGEDGSPVLQMVQANA